MFVELVILFVVFLLIVVKRKQGPKGLPPGEWGYPLLGYFPNKGERAPDMVNRLRAKHGDVFMAMVGSRLNIFLCDHEIIKNVLAKQNSASRPDIFSLKFISKAHNTGIVTANGSVWHSNRRFVLRVLKDLGLGKSTLEDNIKVEIDYFIKTLKQNTNKGFKVENSLNVVILNVIWGLMAGRRFDIDDEEIKIFTKFFVQLFTTREGPLLILDIYPWINPYVPYFVKKYWMKLDTLKTTRDNLQDYIKKVIIECEANLNKDDPRHFIDMYLLDREEQKDNPELKHRNIDDTDLITTVSDLFVAGSDTTAATIKWMFLYMAKYQNIQKKIQKEIDSVVPRSRYPQLEDKSSLPYLEAAIHDLNRVIAFVPTGVPHEISEDCIIKGFNIPKGAMIIPCIQSVHHDKKYWLKPYDFYPEHFLTEDGKFTLPREGYMPFGIGRRQCIGESLAKMELYLFTSAILQTFDITEPEGNPITLNPEHGANLLNVPREQDLILKIRK